MYKYNLLVCDKKIHSSATSHDNFIVALRYTFLHMQGVLRIPITIIPETLKIMKFYFLFYCF